LLQKVSHIDSILQNMYVIAKKNRFLFNSFLCKFTMKKSIIKCKNAIFVFHFEFPFWILKRSENLLEMKRISQFKSPRIHSIRLHRLTMNNVCERNCGEFRNKFN
jgi:hypothetical protein